MELCYDFETVYTMQCPDVGDMTRLEKSDISWLPLHGNSPQEGVPLMVLHWQTPDFESSWEMLILEIKVINTISVFGTKGKLKLVTTLNNE